MQLKLCSQEVEPIKIIIIAVLNHRIFKICKPAIIPFPFLVPARTPGIQSTLHKIDSKHNIPYPDANKSEDVPGSE